MTDLTEEIREFEQACRAIRHAFDAMFHKAKQADDLEKDLAAAREEALDLRDQLQSVTEVINGSSTLAHLDAYRHADWHLGEEAREENRPTR